MDYLYYRIFIIAKVISMGLSKPHYRAAFLITLPVCFNLLSISVLLGIEVKKAQLGVYALVLFLLYFLFLRFFLDTSRYKRSIKKYRSENVVKTVLASIVYIVYFLGSIIVFVKLKIS